MSEKLRRVLAGDVPFGSCYSDQCRCQLPVGAGDNSRRPGRRLLYHRLDFMSLSLRHVCEILLCTLRALGGPMGGPSAPLGPRSLTPSCLHHALLPPSVISTFKKYTVSFTRLVLRSSRLLFMVGGDKGVVMYIWNIMFCKSMLDLLNYLFKTISFSIKNGDRFSDFLK